MIFIPLIILLMWSLGVEIFIVENATERFSFISNLERDPEHSKYSLIDALFSETL